ncbi:hypothetical protein [Roseicella aerolata]|uniref:Uncharacterized protein n=1 Tax=Roseicella aerolata TaxID=2883479 RepID=A0A9X1IFF3_9PROT|nr:hypothetical protein [Roseicella aerolata]MCB4823650.1 hypothetical protein [Roseicella aerolata]
MADHSLMDVEPPRRPRRGPPPRLYVIARQSPVPWLRVRRLGEADRAALLAHLQGLAAAERNARQRGSLDEAAITACCEAIDFRSAVIFGAIAGNAVIAAACGAPGTEDAEVVATEDAAYRQRDLGPMLVQQVLGVQSATGCTGTMGEAGTALLALMRHLGGRVTWRSEEVAALA